MVASSSLHTKESNWNLFLYSLQKLLDVGLSYWVQIILAEGEGIPVFLCTQRPFMKRLDQKIDAIWANTLQNATTSTSHPLLANASKYV